MTSEISTIEIEDKLISLQTSFSLKEMCERKASIAQNCYYFSSRYIAYMTKDEREFYKERLELIKKYGEKHEKIDQELPQEILDMKPGLEKDEEFVLRLVEMYREPLQAVL